MAKTVKITRNELQRQRGNCALFGYVIGLAVGVYVGIEAGKTQGRAEAYKAIRQSDLESAVKNLTWEAQMRKDKETINGSAS